MAKPQAHASPRAKAKTPPRRTKHKIMWTGLLAWPAAITIYILHTLNLAVIDSRTFDFVSIWCIAAGCIALHAAALRGPRRWFSARVLTLLAAAAGGCALLATVMVAVERIDPTPSDLLVGLCLLLGPAIIGINAADTLGATQDGTQGPVQVGGVGDNEVLAALDVFENLTVQQVADCIRALQAVAAARGSEEKHHAALHVVHTWDSMNGSGAHKL